MPRRASAPPFWFQLLFALASALMVRVAVEQIAPAPSQPGPGADVQQAFWFLVGLIASWVWTGVQVAGKITLQILAWSVKLLWAFAVAVSNAATAVGKAVVMGFRKSWDFLRLTYDSVLKPAWQQFWKFVDWAKTTLERIFTPILNFLEKIRGYVMDFYATYVRPILDVIGFARRVLGILAAFGIEWAKALDRKLAELEAKIQLPFTFVLAKINEVINLVNTIVTAGGLFQRLALIRSLERDMRYVGRAFVNWRSAPITATEFAAIKAALRGQTLAQAEADARAHILGTGGPRAGLINEMVQHWTIQIERRP